MSRSRRRATRRLRRVFRRAVLRYVRAPPPPPQLAGADRRVTIVLVTAWGMGGTIRANLNVAAHLAAAGYDVEIISIVRGQGRRQPFFGPFPPGVRVLTLDDRHAPSLPPGPRLARRLLRGRPSVLMHRQDRAYGDFDLWVDLRLAHALRRRAGFLITTRPGLNLVAAQLSPPGLVLIGEEQMHLGNHARSVRRAMRGRYRRLAALTVLTERDRRAYERHLNGRVRLARMPNTVRPLAGGPADLSARTVLTAGRIHPQKGFDLLVAAYAQVAARHPDWRLRICGAGRDRDALEAQVHALGLADVVTLPGPVRDMGAEMAAASLFVLSSRYEGLPLVLLEAMSLSMGVVSFDCPTGPSDIVADHENGLLVAPRDVDALAAAVCEMIEDEPLRRRCAAAAVLTAGAYDIAAIGPRWEALLEELAVERGTGGAGRR